MKSKFEFTKMHGAGNDFIMIADLSVEFEESPGLIGSLCAQHTGIGADGLILIRPATDRCDFRMRYFNRDGGEADMCGNGARCTAMFAYSSGVAGRSMRFQTEAGPVEAEVKGESVKIGIGSVTSFRTGIVLKEFGEKVSFAVCGVPHAVILNDSGEDWIGDKFVRAAELVRNASYFHPRGTNVNLVTVTGPDSFSYRTYERGVEDETLACGTGAVASSVIMAKLGMSKPPVSCLTSGGDILEVTFDLDEDGARNCYLTGPAVESFKGIFSISDYS